MSKQQQQVNTPVKKYILTFDISKTITLIDNAQGFNKEETLMDILVGYAWGRIDEKNPLLWKLGHNQFVKNPPQQGLLSYKQFVEETLHREKTEQEEPNEEERIKYNNEQRKNKRFLYFNFVKQGNPGLKLRADYDKIQKYLFLPRIVQDELRIQKDVGEDQQQPQDTPQQQIQEENDQNKHPLFDLFKDGRYFILPYFFRMIMSLKKAKKEFGIVFRSCGDDLQKVIREFNKFCQGEHPCYNGRNNQPLARFDGSKGTKNYQILEQQQIIFFRDSEKLEDLNAVFGSLKRNDKKNKTLEEAYEKELDDETVVIEKTGTNVYLRIMELLKESCAIAISDDQQFQGKNGLNTEGQKPLLIDQTDYSTLQIFFDDQIAEDQSNVVDVWDIIQNEQIPIKKCLNKYLIKVEPLSVIKDPEYFTKQIEMCEKMRIDEIEKIEKGITEEVQVEEKKSEWELLQTSSDADYLRRTIMPILHPALKIVDTERPNDPISFIAVYLLQNKDKIKLPPIPADFYAEKEQKDEKDAINIENQEDKGEEQAEQ